VLQKSFCTVLKNSKWHWALISRGDAGDLIASR
jgi:hypothetical protein